MIIFDQYKELVNKTPENVKLTKEVSDTPYYTRVLETEISELVDGLCKTLMYSSVITTDNIDLQTKTITLHSNKTDNKYLYQILEKLFDIYEIDKDKPFAGKIGNSGLYYCLCDPTSYFNKELFNHYSKGTKIENLSIDFNNDKLQFDIAITLTDKYVYKMIQY